MYLFEEKSMLLMIGQYFFNSFFVTYDFTTLSDLNVNPTDLIEILFIRVFFGGLFDVPKYFTDSSKMSNFFCLGSNLVNFTTKFL